MKRSVGLVLMFALAHCLRGGTSPNIIFILADDLGYGEISCYGQERYATPNIDQLARDGMRFTQHYAGSTLCAPSRNCLLAGQHTGHVTVRNNFIGGGNSGARPALRPDETILPERLRGAGYATALIGKWGLGEEETPAAPWHRGWDFFYGFVNQDHAANHFPEFLYRNERKEPLVENYARAEKVYANDRFTEEALSFLKRARQAKKPFFLYLAYTTPHADLRCPDDALELAKSRHPELVAPGVPRSALVFASMVLRLDRDVGRVISQVSSLGIENDTIIFFASDNGPHDRDGKDNGWFRAAGPFRGIKRDLYEGGIRVPLIVRWPGKIKAGSVTEHVSAFWDFPATAMELAGASPQGLPAESLSYMTTLLGRREIQKAHEFLYWEVSIGGQARQAARILNWKGIRNGLNSATEVYDLAADPGEAINLASQHPLEARELTEVFRTAHSESPDFPLR